MPQHGLLLLLLLLHGDHCAPLCGIMQTATLSTGEGLYYIKGDLLQQLQPDVIVTQSLCNVCSVDLRLVEQVVADMQQQQQQRVASDCCSRHSQQSFKHWHQWQH